MTKHLGILVSPEGEEFYDAYGPMTKLRDRATRFADDHVALRAADQRYGRHQDAFWKSERASRDAALREYRGWTARTETVEDSDERRTGHFIVDYPTGDGDGDAERRYATRDEAAPLCRALPRSEGRAFAVDSY